VSDELYPYLLTLFAQRIGSAVGWPSGVYRENEIKDYLKISLTKHIQDCKIDDICNFDGLTEKLYKELAEAGAFSPHDEKFAGRYYAFRSGKISDYIKSTAAQTDVALASKRVGDRFFPDVFEGFRAQHTAGSLAPISQQVIAAQAWSELNVTDPTLVEIRSRAAGLVNAINQVDLDDRSRANALAHAKAVVDLLEAEDPPWREIVDLLNSPALCAILNAMAIIQLIFGSFS